MWFGPHCMVHIWYMVHIGYMIYPLLHCERVSEFGTRKWIRKAIARSWFKYCVKENKVEQNVVVNNSIPDTTSTIDKLIDKLPTFTPKDGTEKEFNEVITNIKDDFDTLKKEIVSLVISVEIRPTDESDERSPSIVHGGLVDAIGSRGTVPPYRVIADLKNLDQTSKGKIAKFLHQRRLDSLFD